MTAIVIVAGVLAVLAIITVFGTAMIESAHPPAGRFVTVKGGRLHVVELDAEQALDGALPVLLLHGASGNLEDMRLALGDQLRHTHRVILVDRPGHGWSERPEDGASPARQAQMLSEMLEQLGIARAIVVAHSLSGTVATAMALDDPARVAGLVLLAPVTHPWSTGIAWYYSVAAAPLIGPLFARTVVLPVGMVLLRPAVTAVFAPQTPPENYVERAAITLVLRPHNFLANARDVAGLLAFVTTQAPRYPKIEAPTIVIFGDRDTTVSPQIHGHELVDVLPHAKLVLLEGVGHMPHHAAPERVIAAIEEVAAQAAQPR